MKRIVASVFILTLLIAVFSISASADDTVYSEGFFYYTIEDASITIVGYFGTETEVWVPSSIAGYPVNTVAERAFAGTSVQTLHLPDTVRSVEQGATGQATVDYEDSQMQEVVVDKSSDASSTQPSTTGAAKEGSLIVGSGSDEEVMAEEPGDSPIATPSPTTSPKPTREPDPTPTPTASPAPEATAEPAQQPSQNSNTALWLIPLVIVLAAVIVFFVLRRKKKA